ncbi:MAG: hypothetical protein JKY26_14880 [Pseudomonas sp.]|nr:hypothetical protein [Pseudomonas sp.]
MGLNKRSDKRLVALRPAFFALLIWSVLATGCTTAPERADAQASESGLDRLVLQGGPFSLRSYERSAAGRHAWVFIEGDGKPWLRGGRVVAPDPTPKRLLVLGWLNDVPGPALYLGRPCYFGAFAEPSCNSLHWTFGRYSEDVVEGMAQGVQGWLRTRPEIDSLTLVGHSGGGVLALLMAERLSRVTEVVALSAPVDIDAWTGLHGYTPLFASLSPARQAAWRANVQRRFYFGQDDREVPPEIFMPAAGALPQAEVRVIEATGHDCCDPDIWLDASSSK